MSMWQENIPAKRMAKADRVRTFLRSATLNFIRRISRKPNQKWARVVGICHCGFMFSFLIAGCTIGFTGLIGVSVSFVVFALIFLANYICGCCPIELLERRLKGDIPWSE